MVSRRRALGLGAAVAGGVWVAPAILSFDAASATPSGIGPTTSTTAGPGSTTTTTEEPPTTTTTAVTRTITASVVGSISGLVNPAPVTVAVGEPINLVFTREPGYGNGVYYAFETNDGTATEGVDFTGNMSYGEFMSELESSTTITIQTTATGPGSNTAFTVTVWDSA
jgi:hypothetical protein